MLASSKLMRFALLSGSNTRGIASCSVLRANIGFIGLGNMGKGMAVNLTKQGHKVTVYDVNPEAALNMENASIATSPSDVAAQSSDAIVTMLPNNAIVRHVYWEMADSIKKGTLLIDSSTIDPAVCKEVAEKVKQRGAVFVDAPVSGGVNAANAGTLTFMVGASTSSDFERAKKILEAMGKNITHCGEIGTGQAVKICNNMLLAITMIGVSETMNLGKNLGLDSKLLTAVLSSATGRCWSVDTYNPVPGVMENVPSSNHYKGGFGTSLMLKDLGLAQDASTRTLSPTPLGSLAHQIYSVMAASGYAGKDFSSAYEFLKNKK